MLHKLRSRLSPQSSRTYAQSGEDVIVKYIFDALRIARPSYLDLGAHHPTRMSNTYLFYRNGGSGICVEPDPDLFKQFKLRRPRDTSLNVGVGLQHGMADFYVMTSRTLNTFSRDEAERYQSYGKQKIERVVQMPLIPINQIIAEHFAAPPQFLSIDIEGLDLEILQSLDLARYRPTVLCVETLTYTEDRSEQKRTDIIDFVSKQGYFLYADTYINSIFVDTPTWKQRV
jgi:FkbM family methyltransferase